MKKMWAVKCLNKTGIVRTREKARDFKRVLKILHSPNGPHEKYPRVTIHKALVDSDNPTNYMISREVFY